MGQLFARALSALIRDKKKRHAVRDILLGRRSQTLAQWNLDKAGEFYNSLYQFMDVKSLHEYVGQYKKIDEILTLLTPYTAKGVQKVRVGGERDGGYVMLEPGHDGGVAYSLGVSPRSPWDLEMAERGYNVFQFDGTIEAPPDEHPNLHFQKVNIVSPKKDAAGEGKSLDRLFRELGHEKENDIVLQMDIEGFEWEVFNSLSESQLKKFRQIIVELHGMRPNSDELPGKMEILRKISKTHTPVHVHLNNVSYRWPQSLTPMFYSSLWEVSYVRTGDYAFEPCTERFPTPLDAPNIKDIPEIALGNWPQKI